MTKDNFINKLPDSDCNNYVDGKIMATLINSIEDRLAEVETILIQRDFKEISIKNTEKAKELLLETQELIDMI